MKQFVHLKSEISRVKWPWLSILCKLLLVGGLAIGLTSQVARSQGNPNPGAPQPFNLTGAWAADDGAIYYIRHLADNRIWWVGLHNSGYHLGVRFTNVFQGIVNPRNHTVEGSWADVPRGGILQHGRLTLDVVEIASSSPDDNEESPRPPDGPSGPGRSGENRLELRRRTESTTGGFGGTIWRRWSINEPYDITYRFEHVRRYDGEFSNDNRPYKDYAVVFGTIAGEKTGAEPPALSWDDSIARDYCNFVRGGTIFSTTHGLDGDLNFNLMNPQLDPDFWNTGWIRSSSEIQDHLAHNGNQFHTETVMFGRTNNWTGPAIPGLPSAGPGENDCRAAPRVLLPGWMETEGNSVLLNGQPVNGNVVRVAIGVPPGQPPAPPAIGFRVIGPSGVPLTVTLREGMNVRVTGVINLDEHAYDEGPPDFSGAPEVHPVYTIDVLQDFRQPRPGADLTGVWHANDVGTYYLRQVDGNVLWWLGLSRDQGQTFANVFHGFIRTTGGDGKRLANPIIEGDWADVPVGMRGARSSGRLRLVSKGSSQLVTTTTLRAVERTGGFGGSVWNKLYDQTPSNR